MSIAANKSFQQALEEKLTVQNKAGVITSREPSLDKIFTYCCCGGDSTVCFFQ